MAKRFSILAVLVVVILLAAFAITHNQPANNNTVQNKPVAATGQHHGRGLEEARAATKARLDELQKMTPDQWPADAKAHPNHAKTLQDAIKYNTARLAQLNTMTPEQWDAQHAAAHQTKPVARQLPALGPKTNTTTPANTTTPVKQN
jgi:hypothetical protein